MDHGIVALHDLKLTQTQANRLTILVNLMQIMLKILKLDMAKELELAQTDLVGKVAKHQRLYIKMVTTICSWHTMLSLYRITHVL